MQTKTSPAKVQELSNSQYRNLDLSGQLKVLGLLVLAAVFILGVYYSVMLMPVFAEPLIIGSVVVLCLLFIRVMSSASKISE